MPDQTPQSGIKSELTPAQIVMTLLSFWAIPVCGQDSPSRSKSQAVSPQLPGAVSTAPRWIGSDAPFDVAKYFQGVPRDQNAAPLYLDALFEFGSELEVCFPEVRSRRSESAKVRTKRYKELTDGAAANTGGGLSAAAVDDVIKLYDVGYRKLANAQARPRCVFETGASSTMLLPHAQVSRQVVRVIAQDPA